MGKILNIRVSAQTYSEEDVAEAWPKLASMVWPEWFSKRGLEGINKDLPGFSIGDVAIESALGARGHGVVELAGALTDMIKLGELPDNVSKALEAPLEEVDRVNRALAAALGDWDVKKASTLTFDLEDALDRAEQSLDKI